jgi:hypothetical protein
MRIRIIVVSALMASFFIAVSSAAWAQTNVLKAGGVDDDAVAQAYYATIDPLGRRTTQVAWEVENGFRVDELTDMVPPGNRVVTANGYFNDGDLGFWRSIEMVRDKRPGKKGGIAFTTVNYNSESDSINGLNPVSIVNMEYSRGPEGDDWLVKFYVFDEITGDRKNYTNFAPLDPRGEDVYLPAACFSCHGGDDDAQSPIDEYNEGSGETNARFLAFDVKTMIFGTQPDAPSQANLERKFRKFNKAILRTDPTSATKTLIKGLYGGPGLPNLFQDPSYIPASWADDPDNEALYNEVIVPSCRSCHTMSDTKVLSLEWWCNNTDKIEEEVFHEETMPNSYNGWDIFYGIPPNPPSDMEAILSSWLDAGC